MIKMYVDFIDGDVLRTNRLCDCTNNGVSANYDTLFLCREYVTKDDVLEYCKETGENPQRFLKVEEIRSCRRNYARLVQFVHPNNDKVIGGMAGGNYLTSCDSRFSEITGIPYPLAIHDRYETQIEYDILSR